MKNTRTLIRMCAVLLISVLLLMTAVGCGEAADDESKSGNTQSSEKDEQGNEITYIWGSYNGLTGPLTREVDDVNKSETWLLVNEYSGNLYRKIVITYADEAMKDRYSTLIYDNAGHLLYHLTRFAPYDGATEKTIYGEHALTDFETLTNGTESKGGSFTGSWRGDTQNSFWVTSLKNGLPVSTERYFLDGFHMIGAYSRDFKWNYVKGELDSVTIANRSYVPQYSEDGKSLTLTCARENVRSDGIAYPTVETYTFTTDGDDHLVSADYHYHSEDMNNFVRDYHNTLNVEYRNGKPSRSDFTLGEYKSDYTAYTLFNDKGDVSSENNLVYTLGSDDVGAALYTYTDDGKVSTIEFFHDYNTEDPNDVALRIRTTDNGEFLYEEFDDGLLDRAWLRLTELSSKEKQIWYYYKTNDGTVYCQTMRDYYPSGVVKVEENYDIDGIVTSRQENNEHGMATSYVYEGKVCGEMTGPNEYTETSYNDDGTPYFVRVWTYGESTYHYVEYDGSGSVIKESKELYYKH